MLMLMKVRNASTYDASSQATGHQGKTDEEEQPRPPHSSRVTETVFTSNAIFVDEVDDDHAKE